MAGVEVKTFEKADEVNNSFNNAKIEAVKGDEVSDGGHGDEDNEGG